MSTEALDSVRRILRDALQLGARADTLTRDSVLLGGIPEFDSFAVVTVVTMLEEELGVTIGDDEVSAETFETVGALARFYEQKSGV